MELSEGEFQIIRIGRKRLRILLIEGIIVLGVMLICTVPSGVYIAQQYTLLRTQPKRVASIGRRLVEARTERGFLADFSPEAYEMRRARLSKIQPKTEAERALIAVVVSSEATEGKLLHAYLFALGQSQIVKRCTTLVLLVQGGFFLGILAIFSYRTARPFAKILERLASA